jgi:hypothetical protein
MKKIYSHKKSILFPVVVLLMMTGICLSFSLKKENPMLLNGEIRKTIKRNSDKVVLDCSYDVFSSHYRITLHSYLYGRRFSVNPSLLSIGTSNPDIMIAPICKADKDSGMYVSSHSFYSIPTFKKITYVSQGFDVTFKSSICPDSFSLYILPSDYLIYDGSPVITDTITISPIIGG